MIELDPTSQVLGVSHEPNSRGYAYMALDRRRVFLFASCSLRKIAEGIETYCNEEIGRTASYDCASCASSRGYVGSFRIERCSRTDLPQQIQVHRAKFQRVILCPTLKSAWTIGDIPEQKERGESDEFFLEVES
jgi:hypothetical protein